RMRRDVRMKNRREHSAKRRRARIVARKRNLDQMTADLKQFAIFLTKAADFVFDLISLRRLALSLDKLKPRMARDIAGQAIVIGLQPAKSNRAHGFSDSVFSALGSALTLVEGGAVMNCGGAN